jgi:hypothetical protein
VELAYIFVVVGFSIGFVVVWCGLLSVLFSLNAVPTLSGGILVVMF